MANTQRVLRSNLPLRRLPVKGSAAAIEVGDFVFFDDKFQGNTNQHTLRPASSGSAGASAADGRTQFAVWFSGVAHERHDLNSFDKNMGVDVDCEVEVKIANSTGVATAANAKIAYGAKVAIAVNSSNVPLDDLVVIDGLHSVTVADAAAIGRLSRTVENGDTTCWVHVKAVQVMAQSGI